MAVAGALTSGWSSLYAMPSCPEGSAQARKTKGRVRALAGGIETVRNPGSLNDELRRRAWPSGRGKLANKDDIRGGAERRWGAALRRRMLRPGRDVTKRVRIGRVVLCGVPRSPVALRQPWRRRHVRLQPWRCARRTGPVQLGGCEDRQAERELPGQLADGARGPLAEGPRPHLVRQGPRTTRGAEPRGGAGGRAGGGARGAAGRPRLQERAEAAHRPEQGGLRGDLQAGGRRPRGEGCGPAAGARQCQWLRGPRGPVPGGQGGCQAGPVGVHAPPRGQQRPGHLPSFQEEAARGGRG